MYADPFVKRWSTAPLTLTDFVRFAGAAGDFNPVHHDREHARRLGFPDVFAMGMLTASIASEAAVALFGTRRVTGFGVRFRKLVYAGDELEISAEMNGDSLATIDLTVDGDLRLTAWAEASERLAHVFDYDENSRLREATFIVEPGKIGEFARATPEIIDQTDCQFRQLISPSAPEIIPLLFSNAVQHWLGDQWYVGDSVGVALERCLHTESRWSFLRSLHVDEEIYCTTHLVSDVTFDTRSGQKRRKLCFGTGFYDAAGELVQVEQMTIIDLAPPG